MDSNVEVQIDAWLDTIGEQDKTCFPEVLKIYAPTCYGKCEDAVQALVDTVTNELFGSTTYDKTTGCWLDEDTDKIECEPVRVIEAAHHCQKKEQLDEIARAIVNYARRANQKSLSIHNNKFFILRKPALIAKFEEQRQELLKELPKA